MLLFLYKRVHNIHLACIDPTPGIAGAKECLCDGLEVRSIAILVPPNGKLGLQLAGALTAAVPGGAPADHRRQGTLEMLPEEFSLRQADRDNVF